MSSDDREKRDAFRKVVSDANLLAVLIKEDRVISKEVARGMKRNFNCVAFPEEDIPSAMKYINAVELACDGLYVDPNCVVDIREFHGRVEKYIVTC